MPRAIIYDDRLPTLSPLTDLRASFDVRTGALTNLERLRAVLAQMFSIDVAAVVTSPGIAPLAADRTGLPVNPADVGDLPRTVSLSHPSPTDSFPDDDPSSLLIINGRLTLPPVEIAQLEVNQLLVQVAGEASRGASDQDEIAAVRLATDDARAFLADFQTLPDGVTAIGYEDRCLLTYPWHTIAYRDEALGVDLAVLMGRPSIDLPDGVVHIEAGEDDGDPTAGRAHISPTATVYPTVVLDCSKGPIVIDDDAVVRPGAIICGPAYIGLGSTVLDGALLKANTAIGPVCKVAGEVGGTILQGFTNKAHDGHIGDSWIGEWTNLGAGTTNSNLLNTYDAVSFTGPDGKRRRTGLTFLGSIIGDHVKTAIETRLMTGACLGTGTMVASTMAPPNRTPAFAWVTDGEGGPPKVSSYRLAKFEAVARAVMARRGLEMSNAYAARLASLHAGSATAAGY